MAEKTAFEISREIFYSPPGTNDEQRQSIINGEKLIEDYASDRYSKQEVEAIIKQVLELVAERFPASLTTIRSTIKNTNTIHLLKK